MTMCLRTTICLRTTMCLRTKICLLVTICPDRSPRPPVAGQVEGDRGGEDYRIDAVEHAAVAFDHPAPVLDPAVALDGRHDEAAAKPRKRDDQRHQRGV